MIQSITRASPSGAANAPGARQPPGSKATVVAVHSAEARKLAHRQQLRQQQDARRRAERQRVKVPGKCAEILGVPHVYVKVPAAWATVWLPALCHSGAVVVGEQEAGACIAAAGQPRFPHDFPATQAYWCARRPQCQALFHSKACFRCPCIEVTLSTAPEREGRIRVHTATQSLRAARY